ncbi:FKBP-type peptidyl-prolyl cis-trans isomerase [Alloactinosynnema sp. L-07]|uniref:FKBP-type peptidyl-prolyl cis-trans isomerase n=1 Tax=Alloactinosynnema sp. L-07 TaxID=1653480 RepID=UPI0006B4A751|nr:FKBP-type peptidyl-prolyl cis-trans isomerase [Alloactinosynnema sp. L-07]
MRNVGKIMIAAAVAVGLSACAPTEQASTQSAGGPSSPAAASKPASKPAPATTSAAAPATTTAAATGSACTANDVKVVGEPNAKATITVPGGCSVPKDLITKDLAPGTGPEAKAGVTLVVHYTLVTWSDNEPRESSYDGGRPYPLQNLGKSGVIAGWNQGLIGMKQGGRRLLIVPPGLAYGDKGSGPIKPGETLVFVVDAVQVTSA